ncbi:MAG: NAD(P)-dependent alcohol dehydrogenase [Rhizomicrobium sp.]
MKAAVYRHYGPPDVLHIEDVAKPVPADSELLVRVHATTVCAGDVRFRKADPFFLRLLNGLGRPKRIPILGMEFAGTVEQTGSNVTRLSPGDRVFGSAGLKFGTYAEYVCVPDSPLLAAIPINVSFEQAAAIPFGGISALSFLRRSGVGPGQRVLIYGASGSVGTYAVQLAKHLGARVTGVCSTANIGLVGSLGTADVVDYTTTDFSESGHIYDVVFDTVGKAGYRRSMRALRRGGVFAFAASGLLSPTLGRIWASLTGAGKLVSGIARTGASDLSFLMTLVERRQLKPVIDQRYALDEIAEAHRYVEAGHKKGNVVIIVNPNDIPG